MHSVLFVFVAIVIAGLPPVSAAQPDVEYEEPEIIDIAQPDLEMLLAAPKEFINLPPTEELLAAIELGEIDKTRVEKHMPAVDASGPLLAGRTPVATYQGWIHYRPVQQSESRLYKPVVFCSAHGDAMVWRFCQDESWTRLETGAMKKPIRFNGDLSDAEVEQIFEFVDSAGLITTADSRWVSSEHIFQIIKYAHAGNRINVYVSDGEHFGETIFLRKFAGAAGQSQFELTTYECGGKVRGQTVVQVASTTEPVGMSCAAN